MGDNKSCENCIHSGGYAVTGYLRCLGPAPVIFCEDVKQPCECWEKAKESDG